MELGTRGAGPSGDSGRQIKGFRFPVLFVGARPVLLAEGGFLGGPGAAQQTVLLTSGGLAASALGVDAAIEAVPQVADGVSRVFWRRRRGGERGLKIEMRSVEARI
jgi:hypothetical protein